MFWVYPEFDKSYYSGRRGIKFLKCNFSISGKGLEQICYNLPKVGREVAKSRRNKQPWMVYPHKSNAKICLKLSSMNFPNSISYRFDFWNISKPKHLGRIMTYDDKIQYSKKHKLKPRMEKWK